jgi:septum formation protein
VKLEPPLWLASRSPRRQQLLSDAGISIRVHPPDIDDAKLQRGAVSPAAWVMALAYLKARRGADLLRHTVDCYGAWWDSWAKHRMPGIVIGADTVCVCDDELLGQPRDAGDARRMLRLLRHRAHETITGVCLISLRTTARILFYDRATVRIGPLTDDQLEHYIATEDWRGKAGAYNLSERIDASWPITCTGDPATVMGLPVKALTKVLNQCRAADVA